ncbi:MAG: cytochrome P450 [Nitrospira sp. CR1.3]|nr:cytochrome P450 [Nitrospira sp. CR1.3]
MPLNLQDIQGNILTRYNASCATYLLYRVDLIEPAREWLRALCARITTEGQVANGMPQSMVNVAVTYQGLKALGLSPSFLSTFPSEFQKGMKQRATTLCDFGASAPQNWTGVLGTRQVHVLVVVHGANRNDCNRKVAEVRREEPQSNGRTFGIYLLGEETADGLPGESEHFGFRDGISQPWIEGSNPGPPTEPHGGKRTGRDTFRPLKLGEFLLGHKDEIDRLPPAPQPEPLGNNGTYLVLRKLQQDVARFRREMAAQASRVFGEPAQANRLAAMMIGRWPSGCPVHLSPDRDNPEIANDSGQVNAFTYLGDDVGNRCPVGAHIRRTNPRDWPTDGQGNLVVEPTSTRHRMIRRSLPYGTALEGNNDDERDRGLMFAAFVADIGRQFEFVQLNWINSGDPFRMDRTDRDPLIGNNRDTGDLPAEGQPHRETPRKFTAPSATRLPWALNLPEFVTTKGGEYFFVPSLTALLGIATQGFSSFLREFSELGMRVQDPAKRSIAQTKLINDWLVNRPKEILEELMKFASGPEGRIFQMPGYLVFGDPRFSIPPIAIVTKYDDVIEILDHERHPEMSVALYRERMEIPPPRPPRGPFILGREIHEPFYGREMPLLRDAVQNSPVSTREFIRETLNDILGPILNRLRPTGRLDVIQDLAWPVPLEINTKYFGVPGPDRETFKRWLRDIYRDLFLNLRRIPEWTRAADLAVAEMNPYLDGLIQQISENYDEFRPSVLKELIRISRNLPQGTPPYFVRRNIMGLTVGVVETMLKAIARTIDQLIRRPQQLREAQEAAREAQESDQDEARERGRNRVLQYAFEAMRFNPQNHVLFRVCGADTTIARDTPRQTDIRKGTLVFAATLPAMFDGEGRFARPTEFNPDRNLNDYLFFGHDGHECMGRLLVPEVFKELFVRLLSLDGLRRANDDPFDPIELFPEHFLLEFNP